MSNARIFVYGTLKRGYCRHPHLANQRFLGAARTAPRYRLVNCGEYPGLLPAAGEGVAVLGEVWQVDAECLRRLDEVEGVEHGLYERRAVELQPPFEAAAVEAYFYLPETRGLPDVGDQWR